MTSYNSAPSVSRAEPAEAVTPAVTEADSVTAHHERTPKTDAERARDYRLRKKLRGSNGGADGPVASEAASESPVEEFKAEHPAPESPPAEPAPGPDISRPPKRVPLKIKTRWLSLPPEIREGVWEREQVIDAAMRRYEGLGQFVLQAERNNTTLLAALKDYSSLETEFRKDPIQGAFYAWEKFGAPL